jgi:hypothetical protein
LADVIDGETDADKHTAGKPLLVGRSPESPQSLGRLRILRIGDVELQLDGHRLVVPGTPVHLPHKELVILQQLMDNAGRVVTRPELLDNAWGPDRTDVRNHLEVHVRRLRTKIESDVNRPTDSHLNSPRDRLHIRLARPDSRPPARVWTQVILDGEDLHAVSSGSKHIDSGSRPARST